jgi:hypothetical protein
MGGDSFTEAFVQKLFLGKRLSGKFHLENLIENSHRRGDLSLGTGVAERRSSFGAFCYSAGSTKASLM